MDRRLMTRRFSAALGDAALLKPSPSSCIGAYIPVSRGFAPCLARARDETRRIIPASNLQPKTMLSPNTKDWDGKDTSC